MRAAGTGWRRRAGGPGPGAWPKCSRRSAPCVRHSAVCVRRPARLLASLHGRSYYAATRTCNFHQFNIAEAKFMEAGSGVTLGVKRRNYSEPFRFCATRPGTAGGGEERLEFHQDVLFAGPNVTFPALGPGDCCDLCSSPARAW